MLIGLISDTHGLLRAEALEALRGSDLILHAGDIGRSEVLDGLREIAPVVAVRGNTDREGWAASLPETQMVEAGGIFVYLLHDRQRLDVSPAVAGIAAVISGHSHRPSIRRDRGVLWINPGSAGPRRFSLPVSVARLHIEPGRLDGEIVKLPALKKRPNENRFPFFSDGE